MKYIILALTILSSNAMAKDIHIKINGMVCSLCSQGITKKLQHVKEVKHLEVDMDKKMVYISTNNDSDIPDIQLKQAIADAGYNVVSIERK